MSRNRSIDHVHPARVVRSSHRARTIPLDSLDEMYPRPNSSSRARASPLARACVVDANEWATIRARAHAGGKDNAPVRRAVRDASEREPRVETESVAKRSVESR